MLATGDTFINSPVPGVPSHLWIVVSDPRLDPEHVVIVNLSSNQGPQGNNCIVDPGDHDYVSRRSYVRFDMARVVSAQKLQELLDRNLVSIRRPSSKQLLNRIRTDLLRSKLAPIEAQRIVRAETEIASE